MPCLEHYDPKDGCFGLVGDCLVCLWCEVMQGVDYFFCLCAIGGHAGEDGKCGVGVCPDHVQPFC
eukprot:1516127-Ditylum_brightwellii.AAC.1